MKKFKIVVIIAILIAIAYYLKKENILESVPPKIYSNDIIYWNTKTPIKIKVEDKESGISFIRAYLDNKSKQISLFQKSFEKRVNSFEFNIVYPKEGLFLNKD